MKGIVQYQFYHITPDPSAAGPVKSAVHSQCFSDSAIVAPCHMLLDLPNDKPHYGQSRMIFHGKADNDTGIEEYFLKMKQQVFEMAGRARWNDDVLRTWERDFEWLDKIQRQGASEFLGFWPEASRDRRRDLLAEKLRSFYGITDTSDQPLVPDVDGQIATANEERRFQQLADLEEELEV